MKSYSHICRAVYSMPWAMQPEKLEAMLAFLDLKMQGVGPSAETLAQIQAAAAITAARGSLLSAAGGGSVAVLPLYGLIMHRGNMMGDISGPQGTSTEQFTAQLRNAMADASIKAIVIDVDSPGGSVEGVQELASEILDARKKKPITAVINSLGASAAYWIASACSEVVAAPSSLTGSIGVYMAHEDKSQALESEGVKMTLVSYGANKTEGNAFQPLDDNARAHMQDLVDSYGLAFEKGVAKGRGVALDAVQKKFGQGRVFPAQQAVKLGMADRVGTLDDVLQKQGVNRGSVGAMSAGGFIELPSASLRADSSDCECECDECIDGDCDDCGHDGCDCKGCSCKSALAKSATALASNRLSAMRLQLDVAAV